MRPLELTRFGAFDVFLPRMCVPRPPRSSYVQNRLHPLWSLRGSQHCGFLASGSRCVPKDVTSQIRGVELQTYSAESLGREGMQRSQTRRRPWAVGDIELTRAPGSHVGVLPQEPEPKAKEAQHPRMSFLSLVKCEYSCEALGACGVWVQGT